MRKALESLPWVRKAEIRYDKKQATVTVEAEHYKPEALVKVLVAAGFGGKVAVPTEDAKKAKFPPGLRVTFHVMGMKKTKSGAT